MIDWLPLLSLALPCWKHNYQFNTGKRQAGLLGTDGLCVISDRSLGPLNTKLGKDMEILWRMALS